MRQTIDAWRELRAIYKLREMYAGTERLGQWVVAEMPKAWPLDFCNDYENALARMYDFKVELGIPVYVTEILPLSIEELEWMNGFDAAEEEYSSWMRDL